jgi:hypothetical protein
MNSATTRMTPHTAEGGLLRLEYLSINKNRLQALPSGARSPTEMYTRGLDPTHDRSLRACVRPMAFLSEVHSSYRFAL